ncbi:hypothetical protein V8E54_015001 [Elaphomyces granulatus]
MEGHCCPAKVYNQERPRYDRDGEQEYHPFRAMVAKAVATALNVAINQDLLTAESPYRYAYDSEWPKWEEYTAVRTDREQTQELPRVEHNQPKSSIRKLRYCSRWQMRRLQPISQLTGMAPG